METYLSKRHTLQMRNLRERLEEEHQALLTREQDKAALELRIGRLTKLILHSTRINTSTAAARKQRMNLLRSFSEHLCPTVSLSIPLLSYRFNTGFVLLHQHQHSCGQNTISGFAKIPSQSTSAPQ